MMVKKEVDKWAREGEWEREERPLALYYTQYYLRVVNVALRALLQVQRGLLQSPAAV